MLHALIFVAASSLQGIAAASIHPDEALFRSIYEELVEIDTSLSADNCIGAVNAMAARLQSAGIAAADIHFPE